VTAKPSRVVDPHIHLWDPARVDWYPYLSGRRDLGMGDVSGMARRFDITTYLAESSGWNVEKVVNVAAATGRHSVDETLEMERRAETDGHPDAIVGGLPATETTAEAVELIDRQLAATRCRGVRLMGDFGGPLPPTDVLGALQDRGLIFELMTHPDQLAEAADGLASVDDLTVVVEHAGWPRSTDRDERERWDTGMTALAGLGDRVVCKLSGLAMPLGSMDVEAFRPWIERSLELFGIDRCMFASNFPVDGLHGTFDELYGAYAAVTADLAPDARDRLFAANAERVYRI